MTGLRLKSIFIFYPILDKCFIPVLARNGLMFFERSILAKV